MTGKPHLNTFRDESIIKGLLTDKDHLSVHTPIYEPAYKRKYIQFCINLFLLTPYNHSQQVSLLRSETLLSIFIFTSSMIQYQTGLLSEAIAIACSLSVGSSHHDDQSTRTRPQGTSPEHTTVHHGEC